MQVRTFSLSSTLLLMKVVFGLVSYHHHRPHRGPPASELCGCPVDAGHTLKPSSLKIPSSLVAAPLSDLRGAELSGESRYLHHLARVDGGTNDEDMRSPWQLLRMYVSTGSAISPVVN